MITVTCLWFELPHMLWKYGIVSSKPGADNCHHFRRKSTERIYLYCHLTCKFKGVMLFSNQESKCVEPEPKMSNPVTISYNHSAKYYLDNHKKYIFTVHWNEHVILTKFWFRLGCNRSCQKDNVRGSQWWRFRQNDNISITLYVPGWDNRRCIHGGLGTSWAEWQPPRWGDSRHGPPFVEGRTAVSYPSSAPRTAQTADRASLRLVCRR